ncbi:MAG: RHS repeat protein, partial [Gammaproteobacteria bacterium]|nr:RHS repeat protein [Gammaproteobacteria bacterium]
GEDKYTYVDTDRLSTIRDPRTSPASTPQLTIRYTFDAWVDKLTDAAGNVTEITYSTVDGKPYTGIDQPEVDGVNNNKAYILDAKRKRVEAIVDAENYGDYRTEQAYKAVASRTRLAEQGLVTSTTDPKDNVTDITYWDDGTGNPKQIDDAAGNETTATYDPGTGQVNLTPLASVTQPGTTSGETRTTSYQQFTSEGKAKKIIDPRGFETTRTFYAASGWMSQTTNPRSFITQYLYDDYGNTTRTTDALSNQSNRIYDNLGRLTTETSPLGLITGYTYDDQGNVLTKTEQGTGINGTYTTSYDYDASSNLIKTTDPRGHVTEYAYDNLNRKEEESYEVDDVQHTRSYTYDAMGRLSSVTNELNQTSETHYDARSKVKYKVNPLQKTTVTYTYDENGNVATVTDAEGRTVTTSYDELNRKTRVEDEQGNYQAWTYNPAGEVETYRDARGETTHYEYDAAGNLTKLTDPKGGVTESTYDKNNNLLTVIDPNLHTTTYTYDALDRRKTTTLHNGEEWEYDYDANGNQLSETTPNGERTVKVYDALNRVTQLTEYGAITRQIDYTYDANSNVLTESSGGNTISYTYDDINRISSVTDRYGKTISYGYDKAGNRTDLTYPADPTYPGNKSISYDYDDANRLKSLTDWLNKKTEYFRNDAGQPTEVVNGNGTKVEYDYDSVGRLTKLINKKANDSVISSHNLTLDEAGNITNAAVNLPLQPALPQSTGTMSYNNNNRILSTGSASFSHDDTGRIIEQDNSGVQTIYNFDINDHITSITRDSTTLSSYGYDLNNNRISQSQNSIETRYVIDPLASLPNVVAETDAQGNVTNYYLYGDGLVSQISAASDSHYYHFDPTGHTLALTDA